MRDALTDFPTNEGTRYFKVDAYANDRYVVDGCSYLVYSTKLHGAEYFQVYALKCGYDDSTWGGRNFYFEHLDERNNKSLDVMLNEKRKTISYGSYTQGLAKKIIEEYTLKEYLEVLEEIRGHQERYILALSLSENS